MAIVVQIIVHGVVFSSFSFWVADWIAEFGGERGPIVFASSLALITSAVVSPFSGWLADRWSIRGVIGIGILTFGGGLGLLSLVRERWELVATYGLSMGIALAFAGPVVSQALTVRWFQTDRGMAIGIVVMGGSLGGLLMPPVVAALLGEFNWRTVAEFLALSSLILAPATWLVLGESPARATPALPVKLVGKSGALRLTTFADILSGKEFYILLLAVVPLYAAEVFIVSNFRQIVADHGFDAGRAALALSVMSFCSLFGKAAAGRITDSSDCRLLFITAAAISGIGFFLLCIASNSWMVMLGSIAISLGTASSAPIIAAIVSQYFGTDVFGRVLGMLSLGHLIAGLSAPLAASLRDHLGSYSMALLSAALVPAVMSFFILRLKLVVPADDTSMQEQAS